MIRRRGWVVPVGLAVVVGLTGLTGCSDRESSAEQPAATTTTFLVETDDGTQAFSRDEEQGSFSFEGDDGKGTLTFDLDGDGVLAEGDGGAFELSPGDVPAGWPGEFPLPERAEVVGGNVVEAGPLRQLTAVYRVPTGGAEVVAFYESALADDLPLVDVRDDRPDTYHGSVSFEGEHVGFLTVTTVEGGSELAVQLIVEDVDS